MGSTSATIAALMFYMAVENLDPSSTTEKKRKYITSGIVLSVLFTPLGAWLISVIIKMKKLPPLSSVS